MIIHLFSPSKDSKVHLFSSFQMFILVNFLAYLKRVWVWVSCLWFISFCLNSMFKEQSKCSGHNRPCSRGIHSHWSIIFLSRSSRIPYTSHIKNLILFLFCWSLRMLSFRHYLRSTLLWMACFVPFVIFYCSLRKLWHCRFCLNMLRWVKSILFDPVGTLSSGYF